MNYQAQKQLLAAVLSILSFTGDVASTTCKGTANAFQGYSPMCLTSSSGAKFDETQSCLKPTVADFDGTCTADKCAQTNIKIAPGVFKNTDGMIWSVAGCFGQTTYFTVCSGPPTLTTTEEPMSTTTSTTSTTAEPTTTTTTTTTTAPPTTESVSTSTSTTMSTTSMSTTGQASTTSPEITSTTTGTTASTTTQTTTMEDTTTTSTSTTTTTEAPSTTSTAPTTTVDPELLPVFNGCLSGAITWTEATCAAQDKVGILADYVNSTKTDEGSFFADYTVAVEASVVGCCDTDNCEVDDGVDREQTCNYGTDSSTSSVSCASDCFTYISKSKGVIHGCLADVDLGDTNFEDVTTCTTTYEDGSCNDVNDECLKCCSTDNCNDWDDKDDLLGIIEESDAMSVYASVLLIVTAYIFTQLS